MMLLSFEVRVEEGLHHRSGQEVQVSKGSLTSSLVILDSSSSSGVPHNHMMRVSWSISDIISGQFQQVTCCKLFHSLPTHIPKMN